MTYPSLCLTLANEHNLTEGMPLAKELSVYNEVLPFWQALITHYLFSQMGKSPLAITDQFVLAYGIHELGLSFDQPIEAISGIPISADRWAVDQDLYMKNIAKCVIPKLRQLYHRELMWKLQSLEQDALYNVQTSFGELVSAKLFPFNGIPVPGSVKQCGDNLINAYRYNRNLTSSQSTVMTSAYHTFMHRLQVVLDGSTKSLDNGNCTMVSRTWVSNVIGAFQCFSTSYKDLNRQYQKVDKNENVSRIDIHTSGKCLGIFVAMIMASGLKHFYGLNLCADIQNYLRTTDSNVDRIVEAQLDVWFTKIPLWKAYESIQPLSVRLLVPAMEDRVYCMLNQLNTQVEHKSSPLNGLNKQEVRVTTGLDIFQRFNKAVQRRAKIEKSIIVD